MDDLMQDYVIAMRNAFFNYAEKCDILTFSSIEYISPDGVGQIKVDIQKANNVYIALCELIHWMMVVFDKTQNNSLAADEMKLLSAIKYIDNMIKHETERLGISDILDTVLAYMCGQNDKEYFIDFKIITKWQDLSKIKANALYANQRNNYENYLVGKETRETVEIAYKIILSLLDKKYLEVFDDGSLVGDYAANRTKKPASKNGVVRPFGERTTNCI